MFENNKEEEQLEVYPNQKKEDKKKIDCNFHIENGTSRAFVEQKLLYLSELNADNNFENEIVIICNKSKRKTSLFFEKIVYSSKQKLNMKDIQCFFTNRQKKYLQYDDNQIMEIIMNRSSETCEFSELAGREKTQILDLLKSKLSSVSEKNNSIENPVQEKRKSEITDKSKEESEIIDQAPQEESESKITKIEELSNQKNVSLLRKFWRRIVLILIFSVIIILVFLKYYLARKFKK